MAEGRLSSSDAERAHDVQIALVAVHGVADQAPCATARSVADLLLGVSQDAAGAVEYGSFVEQPLRIEVRRLAPLPDAEMTRLPEPSSKPAKREILGSEFAAHLERRGKRREGEAPQPSIDLQFTSAEIANYDAALDPPSYDSVCLSADRVAGTKAKRTRLDVYEMYWADLSRLGSGLLRIFGELYQLFFHLSSLGRNTVDLGAAAHPGSGAWRIYRLLQRSCDWTLAVPIGILNLFLPLLVGLFGLALVPEQAVPIWATVIWALLGLLAAGALIYRRSRQPFLWWLAVQLAGFALGGVVGHGYGLSPTLWLINGGALIVFALIWWLAQMYDRRRPGAFVASLVIMLVLGVSIQVRAAEAATGAQAVVQAVMYQVELVFLALVILWPALIGGQILTWLFGECLIWRAPDGRSLDPESPRRQVRRVVWTGRLGFALSTSLFLIVTLSVWAALLWVLLPAKPSDPAHADHAQDSQKPSAWGQVLKTPYMPSFDCRWTKADHSASGTEIPHVGRLNCQSPPRPLDSYAEELLERSGGPLFKVFFLCTAFSFLMLIWAMIPSVAAEIAAPRDGDSTASRRMGFWLDNGFRLARLAGSVLVSGLLLALAVGGVLSWHYGPAAEPIGGSGLLKAAGLLLGGTTLSVVALGSRLGKLLVGLRPVLDIALDVDNWLRERPLNHNPKSRILARYSSLLRYIGARRDPDGGKYDAVVIVAHSQGTVISADLLRFLRAHPGRWPFDADTPVYLLTMGCPLRQLYGLRFPHLYAWSRYRLEQSEAPLDKRETAIPSTRQPLPDELGVALWVNAYRSGDYVGRRLWIRDDDPARWDPAGATGDAIASDAPGPAGADVRHAHRIEFCLGPGAHTHYFDQTAQRVAQAIDQLIAIAIEGKPAYRHDYPVFTQ